MNLARLLFKIYEKTIKAEMNRPGETVYIVQSLKIKDQVNS